jgi:hypothetical protein
MVLAISFSASSALAYCSSCNSGVAPAYSVGYAAPATYTTAYAPTYTTAYAPTYTTAYAPAYTTTNSGWYPGYWLGRANRSIWGVPQTTYYAPTYTAAYATTAYYAPTTSYYAGYAAPACSTCTASYAPACSSCSTCSTCTASYAPACSACSTCGTTVVSGASSCPNCTAGTVSQAAYTESTPSSTYVPPTSGSTSTEPTPSLDLDELVPHERSMDVQKPVTPEPAPADDTEASDESANFQAPTLLDPNDRTAQRHMAPVWTAVYHRIGGAAPAVQPISHSEPTSSAEQAEADAAGWTSAAN